MPLPGFNMEYLELYNIYFSWVEMIYKQFFKSTTAVLVVLLQL